MPQSLVIIDFWLHFLPVFKHPNFSTLKNLNMFVLFKREHGNKANIYKYINFEIMRNTAKKVTNVNTVKEVTQTVKRVLSEEQKQAMKLKREANPQFSHLVSKQAKIERKDAKKQLIEAKRLSNELTKESTNKYENEAILKASNTFVNVVCKDEELMSLTIEATRVSKSENYSPFFFAQTIQRVVKLSRSKLAYSYKDALNVIIVQRLSNTEN